MLDAVKVCEEVDKAANDKETSLFGPSGKMGIIVEVQHFVTA